MAKQTIPMRARKSTYDVSKLRNAPRQKRSELLTLRVLDAAEVVIRRDGLDSFTISSVASEAKVSVGGLYGRFANREEIVRAVHRQALLRIEAEAAEWAAEVHASVESMVTALVERLTVFFESNGGLIPGLEINSSAQMAIMQLEVSLREDLVTKLSAHGEHDSEVDWAPAAAIMVHVMLGSLVRHVAMKRNIERTVLSWDALRQELPRVLVGYLRISSLDRF